MTGFRFLTAGESHGPALTVIVEGVPGGLPLGEAQIARDLARRQGGYGRGRRQQIERDFARITGGVRHGTTIGSPIALWIENADHQNANWRVRMSVDPVAEEMERITLLRPGHADLPGTQKYGYADVRPILERSSARETAARVAAGAVARALVGAVGITIHSHTVSIGHVEAEPPAGAIDWEAVEASPVRVADPQAEPRMVAAIDAAKDALDSLGGIFEVRASGVPIGLGSHVQWDRRLDAQIAQAFVSINAVKGVEIGDAFANARRRGSQAQDAILPVSQWPRGERWARGSNHAGGLEGGMSNGQEIVVRGALKPLSTIPSRMPSADLLTGEAAPSFYERSDACVVPAAGVIGEAMLALVLARAVLEKFGGDHIDELRRNCAAYQATVGPREPRP
ncbi:MAG: chorismate synthase [Dehalococcoidia bacterium]|nr:chorismate synthase [Dehalococcoidia bacterium]